MGNACSSGAEVFCNAGEFSALLKGSSSSYGVHLWVNEVLEMSLLFLVVVHQYRVSQGGKENLVQEGSWCFSGTP